jgi:hypothetical protein
VSPFSLRSCHSRIVREHDPLQGNRILLQQNLNLFNKQILLHCLKRTHFFINLNFFHSSSTFYDKDKNFTGYPQPLVTYTNLIDPLSLSMIRKALSKVSGIYAFQNIKTNEIVYVGSSSNLTVRIMDHLTGRRSNIVLKQAFEKYGLLSFKFLILEIYEFDWDLPTKDNKKLLLSIEQKYLDSIKPRYNFASIAGSPLGYKHTDKARATISAHKQGSNNPAFGRTGDKNPMFGQIAATAKTVYFYNINYVLEQQYTSQVEASKALNVSNQTIRNYIKSGKLWNNTYYIKESKLKPEE